MIVQAKWMNLRGGMSKRDMLHACVAVRNKCEMSDRVADFRGGVSERLVERAAK